MSAPRTYSTLEYLLQLEAAMPAALACPAGDAAAMSAWRERAVPKVAELLGSFPTERVPLHAEVVGRITEDGYIRETIVFDSEPGVSVPAYLLLPPDMDAK